MLRPLPRAGQSRLVQAMRVIETLLGPRSEPRTPYILRSHQPGDMGWVIHRHGALYSQEYGYDETFEALVAEIAAKFIQQFDPRRERCWIAEKDGEIVGSVFLVRESPESKPWPNCDCCMWSLRPADWVSASVWSTSAFASHARRATKRLFCGRKANCLPPGTYIGKLDFDCCSTKNIAAGGARIWYLKSGN